MVCCIGQIQGGGVLIHMQEGIEEDKLLLQENAEQKHPSTLKNEQNQNPKMIYWHCCRNDRMLSGARNEFARLGPDHVES